MKTIVIVLRAQGRVSLRVWYLYVEMEAVGWRGPNQTVSRFNRDMVVLGQCRLRARLVHVLCVDKVVL